MSMVSHSVIIVISYTRLGAETQQSMNKIYLSYYAIDLAAYKLQHRNEMGIGVILACARKIRRQYLYKCRCAMVKIRMIISLCLRHVLLHQIVVNFCCLVVSNRFKYCFL